MEKRVIPFSNIQLVYLAFAYCAGKSYLFNMFFGWRESTTESCTFILSKRAWRKLEHLITPGVDVEIELRTNEEISKLPKW